MTDWRRIEEAPKDGKPLLLWARLKSCPPEPNDRYPIFGFWDRSIQQWKVYPEQLNRAEGLIPTHWAELSEPPMAQETEQ